MKIFYGTDMHDDFDSLILFYEFAKANDADLIIVSGDLADDTIPIENLEQRNELFTQMKSLAMHALQSRPWIKDLTVYEMFNAMPIIAQELIQQHHQPDYVKNLAKGYLDNLKKALPEMERTYHKLNIMANDNVLFIPGDYDRDIQLLDERFNALKQADMHKKSREIKGVKIAGYGGACGQDFGPVAFRTVPLEITVAFNEGIRQTGSSIEGTLEHELVSEPRKFLMQEQPHIAIVHNPPQGYLDTVVVPGPQGPVEQHTGSIGLREYAESGLANIILCGHIHEAKGIVFAHSEDYSALPTVLINPGNLGRHLVSSGLVNFAEIMVDDETKRFESATFYSSSNVRRSESIRPTSRVFMQGTSLKRLEMAGEIMLSEALPPSMTLKDCASEDDYKKQQERFFCLVQDSEK